MLFNYELLKSNLISKKIPKPLSGTLSGHAAGEPFDKHVYSEIKNKFTPSTYRQYEYLNEIFLKNYDQKEQIVFSEIFDNKASEFLLSRGKTAMLNWSPNSQFVEKQNDTADIIVVKDSFMDIIDIKTRNRGLVAQPPNIISAFKLAKLMTVLIDENDFDSINIIYIEIEWKLEGDFLVCKDVHVRDLFKANPSKLYINWAAAMQIQFHVGQLEQTYKLNKKNWAIEYLRNYTHQARKRSDDMIVKFAQPFEKYII